MNIIVEDGSIVDGANSYIDAEFVTGFLNLRGVDLPTGGVDSLIVRAADYLEGKNFIGTKVEPFQPMQWPRKDAVIDNYYFPTDRIPDALKRAQCEAVLAIIRGNDPTAIAEAQVASEAVSGAVSTTYAVKAGDTSPVGSPALDAALRPLLGFTGSGMFRTIRV